MLGDQATVIRAVTLTRRSGNSYCIRFDDAVGNLGDVHVHALRDATSGTLSICTDSNPACVSFTFNPGTPNPNPHGPANKFGNVSITNTSPGSVVYGGNFVAGNLTCSGNTFVTNLGIQSIVLGKESGQCVGL